MLKNLVFNMQNELNVAANLRKFHTFTLHLVTLLG